MIWQRRTLVLALPLWLLACGGSDDGIVDPAAVDGDAGTVDPGGAVDPTDPDPTSADDPSDVPLSDEEQEYGEEGDDHVSEEEIAAGAASTAGFSAPQFNEANGIAGNAAHPNVDPKGQVPANLKGNALAYLDANKDKFKNTKYMTIIDMGLPSGKERMYVIDLSSGAVSTTVVAHGSGSDPGYTGIATRFSNKSGSNMTSLGFYKTAELYTSSRAFGKGMKLDGLQSTNNNARARGVVMHGASYVSRGRAKQGRSSGCPAVPMNERDGLFSKLSGGSLLLIEKGTTAQDGCDGKADGYYCSTITKSAAYNCRNGARAGSTNCSDSSKTCKSSGSNGQATISGGTLSCQ